MKDGATIYKVAVTTDQGQFLAYAKKELPPYGAGDKVMVEPTNKTDKDTNLPCAKIKKEQASFGGGFKRGGAPQKSDAGMQVGNAVTNAVNILIARGSTEPEQIRKGLATLVPIILDEGTKARKELEGGAG